MLRDRFAQVVGASVVQEEEALADAPQWRRAKLPATGAALRDAVREPVPHVMDCKVTVRLEGHVGQRRDR